MTKGIGLVDAFDKARCVGVPIVAIRTPDPYATVGTIKKDPRFKGFAMVQWDAARGITAVNDDGDKMLKLAKLVPLPGQPSETVGFVEAMLIAVEKLPRGTILFAHNAHRQLQAAEPLAVAAAVQAVANVREPFKKDFRTLVFVGPSTAMPPEIDGDVFMLTEALPDDATLRQIVVEIHASAKLKRPPNDVLDRSVDAVTGLKQFSAEQVTAVALEEGSGVDVDRMWDFKRTVIEQTPGLSVYRGGETFDDLRGLDSVKARLRAHKGAKTPVGVVVWIDEGADVFSNVEQDTSGVKTDQQRALLVEMEQNNWRGMIAVGVPGSGKSAIARAFGNEAGVPTIAIDFAAMESKYVGESEGRLRAALAVVKAIGRGRAFFVLTCNSLKGIRPQFMRRFKRGTFFFDLPTREERDAIWALYRTKYGIDPKQDRPGDEGWTGAEIRECCESAWDTGLSLLEASRFIIPVARARAVEIEAMRREAHHRFLDASRPGAYEYRQDVMEEHLRAINLKDPTSIQAGPSKPQ